MFTAQWHHTSLEIIYCKYFLFTALNFSSKTTYANAQKMPKPCALIS